GFRCVACCSHTPHSPTMIHDPNEAGLPLDASQESANNGSASGASPSAADAPQPATEDSNLATTSPETLHLRRIRSFVTRAGRVSPGQRRAIDDLGPRFVLPYAQQQADWDAVFGRHAPRVLEIGFGMGATTAEIAARRQDDDFLGVEVHEPGVG